MRLDDPLEEAAEFAQVGRLRRQQPDDRLPVHGQRTHTNARTRKGKAKPIAGKKK